MTLKNAPLIFFTDKKCDVCGESYKPVRAKQRFCSTQCHNRYHNTERLKKTTEFADVLRILQKNHEILSNLWKAGKKKILLAELLKLGFKSEYITSFSQKERINFVFNTAYRLIAGEQVEIFKISPNK